MQVTAFPMEEEQVHQQDNNQSQSHPILPPPPIETNNNMSGFSMMPSLPVVLPVPIENPMENLTLGQTGQLNTGGTKLVRPVPVIPAPQASKVSDLNLNLNLVADPSPLSLNLSLPSEQRESSSRHSAFQAMQSFNSGDSNSIISVA